MLVVDSTAVGLRFFSIDAEHDLFMQLNAAARTCWYFLG